MIEAKLAVDKAALDNLMPPEACVVTYSKDGNLEVWWTLKSFQNANADLMATYMLGDLFLADDGGWASRRISKIRYAGKFKFDKEFALVYKDFVAMVSEKLMPIGQEVADVIVKAKSSSDPKYLITTQYNVDGLEFETEAEANRYVKVVKIFDEFQKAGAVDFEPLEALINHMIDNHNAYQNILQGK